MALSDIQNQILIHQSTLPGVGGGGGSSAGDGVCLETLLLPPPRPNFLTIKGPEDQIRKRKRLNLFHDDPIIDTMNRRPTTCPKLDLRLNLSPPRPYPHNDHRRLSLDSISPNQSSEYSISPPSSCLSSELSQLDDGGPIISSSSSSSMVLVGCPRCLMYVMLSEDDPKCPKCKSSVLLDFVGGGIGSVNTIQTAPPVVTTTGAPTDHV